MTMHDTDAWKDYSESDAAADVERRASRDGDYQEGERCKNCFHSCFRCCLDYDGSGTCRIGKVEDDMQKGKPIQPWGGCPCFEWGHWEWVDQARDLYKRVLGKGASDDQTANGDTHVDD